MSKTNKAKPAPARPNLPQYPPAEPIKKLYGLGLGALSGCLWFLSCADFDIWPLAWVAMVPGFWAIVQAQNRKWAFLYAWVIGIVANAGGFYWITGLLARFGHLPMPIAIFGLLLLSAYQGLVFGLFGYVVRRVLDKAKQQGRGAPPFAFLAPVFMVTGELLVPFIFPWYLAITQAWVLPVIQVAEFTGPLGVTALLLAVSGGVFDAIIRRGKSRYRPLAVATGVTLVCVAFGFWRISSVEKARNQAPSILVGLVQGNIPFDEKGVNRRDLAQKQLGQLQDVSVQLANQGADLLVWTESSYPFYIARDQTADFREDAMQRIRRGFTPPLVLGAITADRTNREQPPYNSALMLESNGQFSARFDKIFLLVFGEYIPLYDSVPWIRKIMPRNAGHFSRGKDIVTFPFTHEGASYKLGPLICYEDILSDFGRKLGKLHPHLFVNITNDAWFGDTSEPWEHLALSVFRSVEHRVDMVRAVNTGVSAIISATGEVTHKSYAVDPKITPRDASGLIGKVALREAGHTIYAKLGDWLGYLAALISAWLLWKTRARVV